MDIWKLQQVKFVGSECLYDRATGKLSQLTVDKFFYLEQMKLYGWRAGFLATFYYKQPASTIFAENRKREKLLLITQQFDQILAVGKYWRPPSFQSEIRRGLLISKVKYNDAAANFEIPSKINFCLEKLYSRVFHKIQNDQRADASCNHSTMFRSSLEFFQNHNPQGKSDTR